VLKVELGSVITGVLTIPDLLRFEVWTLCVVNPGYLLRLTVDWVVEWMLVCCPMFLCSVVNPGYLARSHKLSSWFDHVQIVFPMMLAFGNVIECYEKVSKQLDPSCKQHGVNGAHSWEQYGNKDKPVSP
jgi:hypothetical protein